MIAFIPSEIDDDDLVEMLNDNEENIRLKSDLSFTGNRYKRNIEIRDLANQNIIILEELRTRRQTNKRD